MSDHEETRRLVQQELRAYLGSPLTRFLPVVATALAFTLLIVLVPDGQGSRAGDAAASQGLSDGSAVGAPSSALNGGTGSGSGNAPGAPGAVAGVGPSESTARGATGGASVGGAGTAAGAPGAAVNGTRCGGGIRQFAFTPYAPYCVPRFTGNNGGATSHGVTATTITLVMRTTDGADATAGALNAATFDENVADMRTLIEFFNKQFELYGRRVVLKTFKGNGNGGAEAGGQDQAGAAADAQTAYSMGAFMDPMYADVGSYVDAKSTAKIINFSIASNQKTLNARAPYQYQIQYPVSEEIGSGMAALVCQRMANSAAKFAGDAATRTKPRKFAYIEPSQGQQQGGGAAFVAGVKKCGVSAQLLNYPIGPDQYASYAQQTALRLKSDGVTTIVSAADPIFMQFLTTSATNGQYYPEWVITNGPPEPQVLPRLWNRNQVANMLFTSLWELPDKPLRDTNCYKVFKLAASNATPKTGNNLPTVCSGLLAVFGALQSAGPNLTPSNFQQGWFSQPGVTTAGQFGLWTFGAGARTPLHHYKLAYYLRDQTSKFDGQQGTFAACQEPWYPYLRASLGSGQLRCALPGH